LGSADAVKRCSKNDFTHHPTPRTKHRIHHGNTTIVTKMGPMIAVGSAKAQGWKVKPVYGSEPHRGWPTFCRTWRPIEGTQLPQASYLSLDWEVSFTSLCGLASSHPGFLRGLPGKEA
jgi:hypothetical protein